MVIDINRTIVGALILIFFIFSYILKYDYLVLLTISLLILYDIYKSGFLNNFYDYILLILFLFSLPFIYLNFEIIKLFNFIIITLCLLILLKPKHNKKIFFLFIILVFTQNFFSIFLNNRELMYFTIFIAFYNDTLAYIFGRFIKGPLVIPKISPNKTWSGTLISFVLSFIVIYLYGFPFILSILLSLSLFFGDIFFSFIKRNNNLKDFSNILGGHGGILDRLDSMFIFIIILNYYS